MGNNRWDSDVSAVYSVRSTSRKTQRTEQIFTSRGMPKELDPANVILRESRDSEKNPESTAIIVGLDVTGSMGIIATELARGKLGKLMEDIFEKRPVSDPHVMIMGIGDVFARDTAPLQVSQFEADIKIDDSLQTLFIEGGGGGNNFESYDLPWFFAATRTAIDCFEKRGKKGYLFTIGDELPPNQEIDKERLKRVFGNNEDIPKSRSEALEIAQEKYDVFHIIIEEGSYARFRKEAVHEAWRELLRKRAIRLNDWTKIAEIIVIAMELNEGTKTLEQIKEDYRSDQSMLNTIRNAFD